MDRETIASGRAEIEHTLKDIRGMVRHYSESAAHQNFTKDWNRVADGISAFLTEYDEAKQDQARLAKLARICTADEENAFGKDVNLRGTPRTITIEYGAWGPNEHGRMDSEFTATGATLHEAIDQIGDRV